MEHHEDKPPNGPHLLQLEDEEPETGPFDRNNDPFEKWRTQAQTEHHDSPKPANGPHLLQLEDEGFVQLSEEEGPSNSTDDPFDQVFKKKKKSNVTLGGASEPAFKNPPAKKNQPMSFSEAISWKHKIITPPSGSLVCGSSVMGDPHPGQKMQCFCEPRIPRKPKWCAKEGGDCKCQNGNLFLGSAGSEKSGNSSFVEMLKDPYTMKKISGS